MAMVTVEFNVAMDAEQKKAGNVKKVKFECSFDGVDPGVVQRHAIANQVVAWQGQIRNSWDKFISGELPKVVQFGQPLFSGGRGAQVPMTKEKATEFLKGQSRLEQVRAIISMMESSKMDVPQGLYDEEELLTMEQAEAEAKRRLAE